MKTPKEGMIMESPSKDSMSVYRNGEWVIYHSASSIAALPAPSPTGDRDCEELKKEVERLKGLIEAAYYYRDGAPRDGYHLKQFKDANNL